ncbi:MAG: ASKHA domain-containing protein [Planctomycetota bacterium]
MAKTYRVTFEPEGKTMFVLDGTTVIEAAGRAEIILNLPCGGKGTCGKCKVEIPVGCPSHTEKELEHLTEDEVHRHTHLACQTHIHGDMTVAIPSETRFFEQKILVEGAGRKVAPEPSVRKTFVKVKEPSLKDQSADMDRVLASIRDIAPDVRVDIDAIRTVPDRLRGGKFAITAVLDEDELLSIEEGDTTAHNYGVAFDIGTTTVVGMLVDMTSGQVVATASRTNPQVVYGDDVISRISYAMENKNGLAELQEQVVAAINEMIAEACREVHVDRRYVYEVFVVGNTTMHHLLLGIHPKNIAQAPYVAAVRKSVEVKAADLGIHINESGRLHAMPNIAGFVGGDTVGVILAAGMMHSSELKLAIDIGTNGELALGTKERMICCSTAAGPAFEGARIKFGMRAADGAIEKVVIHDDVEVNVIGRARPRGLCGTALIDAVAELLRLGIIDPTGKVLPPEEANGNVPDAVRERIVPGGMGHDFVLVHGGETPSGQPILLTQRDVREVQLAKGAIFAGIQILKQELGVKDEDITEVLLAGAFGNFIRRNMAKRIGLLPDIPTDRIKFIGNAAGAGSRMALVAKGCRREAERISAETEYIELGGRPDFQNEFMMAMMYPERLNHA